MKKWQIGAVVCVVIGMLVLWVYTLLYFQNKSQQKDTQNEASVENDVLSQLIEIEADDVPEKVESMSQLTSGSTAGWTHFTNAQHGYSFEFPSSWHHLTGNADVAWDEYFSTENVGSPLEMDVQSIWLTVSARDNSENFTLAEWVEENPATSRYQISQVRELSINGLAAIQRVEDFTHPQANAGDGGSGYAVATYIHAGKKVYEFHTLTVNAEAFDRYRDDYTKIVQSFLLLK